MPDGTVVYQLYVNFNGGSGGKSTVDEAVDRQTQKFNNSLGTENTAIARQTQSFFTKTLAVGVGAEIAQWRVSLIGRNTGSSLAQEKINATMQIGATLIGIGTAFVKGGPVAGIAASLMVGTKLIKDEEQYRYEAQWEGINRSIANERLGTSAAINRSRNV